MGPAPAGAGDSGVRNAGRDVGWQRGRDAGELGELHEETGRVNPGSPAEQEHLQVVQGSSPQAPELPMAQREKRKFGEALGWWEEREFRKGSGKRIKGSGTGESLTAGWEWQHGGGWARQELFLKSPNRFLQGQELRESQVTLEWFLPSLKAPCGNAGLALLAEARTPRCWSRTKPG